MIFDWLCATSIMILYWNVAARNLYLKVYIHLVLPSSFLHLCCWISSYLYEGYVLSIMHSFLVRRQQHQLKTGKESFSSLIKQLFLSNFYRLSSLIQCHFGFLVMKQKVGLTPHICRLLETFEYREEIR